MNWKITAKRLRELREENNLSYERLSQQLSEKYPHFSLSDQSLLKYEVTEDNHKHSGAAASMKAENLWYLADFYGVTVDYLMGRSNNRVINCEEVLKKTGVSENALLFLCERNEENFPNDTLLHGLSFLLEKEKAIPGNHWHNTLNLITDFLFIDYKKRYHICVSNDEVYIERDYRKLYHSKVKAFHYSDVLNNLYKEQIFSNLIELRDNLQKSSYYDSIIDSWEKEDTE